MDTERNFHGIETFESVLKKIKTIFCVLFGEIERSLHKDHILMLDMSINPYKSLSNLELVEWIKLLRQNRKTILFL